MAVLQISRIQQRRGLQQDLPQLASAELGWSIDQRRLFIGNGTLGEGAPIEGVTEILTQHTDLIDVIKFYIFKGEEGGFTSLTGPTVSAPTVRSLQHKFDDFVSVRDFGAIGDGVANDIDAIYRALSQIYKADQVSNTKARRTIYFPAGTYNIAASPEHPYGVIVIPPWVRIVGDGIDSTHIVQTDATMNYVIRFSDSSFVYDSNIGATPFIQMPTDVSIENLTIARDTAGTTLKDFVYVDNIVNLHFRLVKFEGTYESGSTPLLASSAVTYNAFKVNPDNITFELCTFKSLPYVMVCDVPASNIRFNSCLFHTCYSVLRLGNPLSAAGNVPTNIRVTNSVFRNITYYGIDSYQFVTGVVSTGNSYYDVNGTGIAISFQSDGNYSINDFFAYNQDRVLYNDYKVIQLNANVGAVLGTATIGTGSVVTLAPTVGVTFTGITLPSAGVMNYTVGYEATVFGTFTFSGDQFSDEFSVPFGLTPFVTFSMQGQNLMYENTNYSVPLRYNINHF
jgi:hypothetical protein